MQSEKAISADESGGGGCNFLLILLPLFIVSDFE